MSRGRRVYFLCLVVLPALCACVSPLYKVSPLPSSPPGDLARSTPVAGLEVGAAALSEDRAMTQFGANLPIAGVIAIEVRIANHGEQPLKLDSGRFALKDASGKGLKRLTPRIALERVMTYFGVSLYGKEAYRRTLESYETIALKPEAIQPKEERSGILFFGARESTGLTGLVLTFKGGPAPISLKLD